MDELCAVKEGLATLLSNRAACQLRIATSAVGELRAQAAQLALEDCDAALDGGTIASISTAIRSKLTLRRTQAADILCTAAKDVVNEPEEEEHELEQPLASLSVASSSNAAPPTATRTHTAAAAASTTPSASSRAPDRRRRRRQPNAMRIRPSRKREPPEVEPSQGDLMLGSLVESNLELRTDGSCPICMLEWTSTTLSEGFVVALSCNHVVCATCLASMYAASQQEVESAVGSESFSVDFGCMACRRPINPGLVDELGKQIARSHDALLALIGHALRVRPEECEQHAGALLAACSFDHERVMSQLVEALSASHFHDNDASEPESTLAPVTLSSEAKQKIYEEMQRPVLALQEELRKARATLDELYDDASEEYRTCRARIERLQQQLKTQRDQAALSQYSQMNADGLGMGIDRVDLHNMTTQGAQSVIDQFVIPVLAVLPDPFYLITGRGAHNSTGRAVLREATERHLNTRGIPFERDARNNGVLLLHGGAGVS